MVEEKVSFKIYLDKRIEQDKINFWEKTVFQRAYYIGAYAKAVINSSWMSKISKGNETFKNWLSNQIINDRNLDRIFEMAFRFEQKLKLNIRNDNEVRKLCHETPLGKKIGISSSKVSYAFVAGFDDYRNFVSENQIKTDKNKQDNNINKGE